MVTYISLLDLSDELLVKILEDCCEDGYHRDVMQCCRRWADLVISSKGVGSAVAKCHIHSSSHEQKQLHQQLSRWTSLERLQLNGYMDPAFQDDEAITRLFTIAPVNTFGNITYLWLDEAVLHEVVPPVLVTACPNLRELSLVDCHYVTYGTPAYNDMVCQMPTPTAEQYAAWSLREICFDGDHITEDEEPVSDRSIPRIQKQFQQQAQRLLSLTEVSFEDGSHDFWKCVGVPFVRGAAQFLQRVHLHDDVLQDVLMDVHYPALEYLYTATSPLTDTILTAVIEQCPALLHLHVGRLQLKTCHNLGVCVPWKTLSMCGNELQIDQMGMLPFLENSSISSLLDTEYDRVTVQFPRAGAQGSYPTEHDAVQAFKQGIQMIQRLPKSCLDQLAECTWVVVESGQLSPATTLMLLQAVQCIFTSLQYVWFDQLTGLNAAHFQYVSASNCSEVRFTACTFEDGALPQLLEIAPQIHTVEFFKVPEEAILALVLTASRKICVKVYKYWMTDLKWRQRVEKALRFAGKSHLVTIEEI